MGILYCTWHSFKMVEFVHTDQTSLPPPASQTDSEKIFFVPEQSFCFRNSSQVRNLHDRLVRIPLHGEPLGKPAVGADG